MYLLLKNKKTISVAILLLAVILITSLFYQSQNNCSPNKSFLQALDYFNNWQLSKAEFSLTSRTNNLQKNNKIANLYLQILTYEGKLHTAQNYIWKYFAKNDFERPNINLKKAMIYYYLGQIDSSTISAKTALTAGIKIKSASIISQANNILGRIKFYNAEYDSAFTYQKNALKFSNNNNLKNEKANALRQLGVLYWYKGKLDSALNYFYTPALNLYRQINNKVGEATTLSNIGLLYFNWKDWEKKFSYNIKALNIRKIIGDKIGLSDSYFFLSYLPLFNRTMKTIRYTLLKKSYDLSKNIGYAWGKEVAGRSLEFFFTDNLMGKTSLINPKLIIPDSVNYASGEGKMFLLLRKLFVFKNNNNSDSLSATYKSILEFADSLNYEIFRFSSICGYADVLIDQNNLSEAENILKKASSLTYSLKKRKYDYHYINILFAKMYLKKGELIKSFDILKKLTSYYDSLYANKLNNNPSVMGYESALSAIYNSRLSSYELLLDVLFKLKKYNLFFEAAESEKRLSLWQTPKNTKNNSGYSHSDFTELLLQYINSKNTEALEDKLVNEFNSLVTSTIKQQERILGVSKVVSRTLPIKLSVFQKSLKENSTFLEYVFGTKSLYVLLISNRKVLLQKLKINKKKLNNFILFFRKAIARGKLEPNDEMWKQPSLNLYKLLINDIYKSGKIAANEKIIIAPAHSLNLLPFAALILSDNNHLTYLIQNHSITLTHSAEEFYWKNQQKSVSINSIIAFAPNSNNLNFSKNEIAGIPSSIFSKKKILIDNEATLDNFLNNILTYDVIHFAGHASINSINPFYSRLEFSDRDLELFQILKYRMPAKLIILSACKSGIGSGTINDLPTDMDLVSFPRAWITAGAKSVIATLWLVEDKSASILMKLFYQNLRAYKSTRNFNFAEALRKSQISMATDKNIKQYSHPFYWAEFYLTY